MTTEIGTCHVVLYYVILCHAMSCYGMPSRIILCVGAWFCRDDDVMSCVPLSSSMRINVKEILASNYRDMCRETYAAGQPDITTEQLHAFIKLTQGKTLDGA